MQQPMTITRFPFPSLPVLDEEDEVVWRTARANERAECRGPHWLWPQEQMIWYQQRTNAVLRATHELDKMRALPRKLGHSEHDTKPHTEDFGAFFYKRTMKKSQR